MVMNLENLKNITLTAQLLIEAKTQSPRKSSEPHTQKNGTSKLPINPLIDEIDNLLDIYYAWQNHARQHLHTHHQHPAITHPHHQPPTQNTYLHQLQQKCNCFPEKQQMETELKDFTKAGQTLLDYNGTYLPYPCPNCDTTRYWNMAVVRVECKTCGHTHNTHEAKTLAVARARSVLNVDKLRRKLKQRK